MNLDLEKRLNVPVLISESEKWAVSFERGAEMMPVFSQPSVPSCW